VSNEPTSAAKTCIVCHQDCSNRPRQKDGQGRYVCQDCLNKAAVKGAPAKMPAPDKGLDPGLAAALAGVDQGAMAPCPNCGILLKAEAVLCTSCGFDLGKGRATKTRVQNLSARERNAVEKTAKVRRSVNISVEPMHLFTLLVLGIGALAFWAYTDTEAMLFLGIAVGVTFYATMITMIVGAFKDDDSAWGIVGIVSLVFGLAYIGVLYYIFARSDRGMVKAMAYSTVIAFMLYMFVAFGHMSNAKDAPGTPGPATNGSEVAEPDADAPPADTIRFPGGA